LHPTAPSIQTGGQGYANRPLNSLPIPLYMPDGRRGTFSVDRQDPTLTHSQLETARFNRIEVRSSTAVTIQLGKMKRSTAELAEHGRLAATGPKRRCSRASPIGGSERAPRYDIGCFVLTDVLSRRGRIRSRRRRLSPVRAASRKSVAADRPKEKRAVSEENDYHHNPCGPSCGSKPGKHWWSLHLAKDAIAV
jgi:hypothetical protein